MISVKEKINEIVQEQPDDSSYDEILREIAFHRMVEKGLADSDLNRTIGNEEMKHRIKTWQK
ncbi:MAG: hypothetical protein AAB317_04745 [Nitrospirota bacterium]